MGDFASGRNALGVCDVCGFSYKLRELKALTIKRNVTAIIACPVCWDPDHPQRVHAELDHERRHHQPRSQRAAFAEAEATGVGALVPTVRPGHEDRLTSPVRRLERQRPVAILEQHDAFLCRLARDRDVL